jgi:hypothetical protein
MKRPARLVLATAMAVAIAGCAGTANPTASPTQLAAATPSPSLEPTAAPTPTATPAPTLIPYPGPAIPPGTLTIKIAAIKTLAFDRSDLAAPANTPFVMAFDNRDTTACTTCGGAGATGQPHNVAIKLGSDFIFNPLPAIIAPASANYFISQGLAAGTYTFLCTVHPAMHGTLTIT